MKMERWPYLFLLLSSLGFSMCAADDHCNATIGNNAPLLEFCQGEIFTSSSFAADPEVRTFSGVELMVFTGGTGIGVIHLYMASRYSSNACWGNVTQVTFDEFANSTWTCYNEVASFTFQSSLGSPKLLWVYYNHYCQPLGPYQADRFSLRVKTGVFDPTASPKPTLFAAEVFSGSSQNTWVIWANSNAQPSEKALAVNNPPLSNDYQTGCNPISEPSVWSDGGTWWMTLGCLHTLAQLDLDIRVVKANNSLFIGAVTADVLLASGDWCLASKFPKGFQAGSLVQFDGKFYLMVSPLITSTADYEGCVAFSFQGNSLNNPLDLSTGPVGMQNFMRVHSGSCTGGAGSLLPEDKELSRSVVYFYQNRSAPGQFYHLYESTIDQVLYSSSPSSNSAAASLTPLSSFFIFSSLF